MPEPLMVASSMGTFNLYCLFNGCLLKYALVSQWGISDPKIIVPLGVPPFPMSRRRHIRSVINRNCTVTVLTARSAIFTTTTIHCPYVISTTWQP